MFFVSAINGDLRPLQELANQHRSSGLKSVQPLHQSNIVAATTTPADQAQSKEQIVHNDPYRNSQSTPERKIAVTAGQIMSAPVVTILETESATKAWTLFKERRFRHVPVISSGGRLIGILSDRDFIPSLPGGARTPIEDTDRRDVSVREIMKTDILTARPETEIRDVARVMIEHRVGSMPIVDAQGDLVGMLTRTDILRAVVKRAPIELWT